MNSLMLQYTPHLIIFSKPKDPIREAGIQIHTGNVTNIEVDIVDADHSVLAILSVLNNKQLKQLTEKKNILLVQSKEVKYVQSLCMRCPPNSRKITQLGSSFLGCVLSKNTVLTELKLEA